MTLQKRPCLCGAYKILRLSQAAYSNQPINKLDFSNDRKKYVDFTWNRLKMLYQFQEYFKVLRMDNQYSSKEWSQIFRKLPQLFVSKITDKTVEPNFSPIPELTENKMEFKEEEVSMLTSENEKINKESYNLPLISNWNKKEPVDESPKEPKWKTIVSIPSPTTVLSRVKHLLILVDNAESVQSRVKRLEDLVAFLLKNREAKLIAVKEGAIQKLLRIRAKTKDYATHKILRETFVLLGYFDPLPCKGIRILAVDGGGIRGIAVIEMLMKLEELTGKKIYELFDYICGVSTGSILVSCIGTPQGITLEEALTMYVEVGTKLFTQSALSGISKLLWSRAYYDTTMFEQLLKKYVGETPLIKTNRDANCPKLVSVSAIMNHSCIRPYVFRNYALPCNRPSQYLGGCDHTLFEAVRASAAAPTLFQDYCRDGIVHQDGGILVNNPCALAIHEAKLLWPNSEIQCVVSCGTGRYAPVPVAVESESFAKSSSVSWKILFNKILESATDTEAVHTMLNDLLPPNVYFRFNPYLTKMVPMHENRPDRISQLREDTGLYIRRNEEKFVDAATNLLIKRTATQRVQDFLEMKSFEYGLKNTACKL